MAKKEQLGGSGQDAGQKALADTDGLDALPVVFNVGDAITHADGTVGVVTKSQYTDDKHPWRGYFYHVTYERSATTMQDLWHITELKLAVELPESAYAHKEAAAQMLEAGLAADLGRDVEEMEALKQANAALNRTNDGLLKTNRQQSDMLKKAREETELARAAQDKLKDRIRELEALMQGERRIEVKTVTRCFAHNAAGQEDAALATYLNAGWCIEHTGWTLIKKDGDPRYWHYEALLLVREAGAGSPDGQGRLFERRTERSLPPLRQEAQPERPPEAAAFRAALGQMYRGELSPRQVGALGNKRALAVGQTAYQERTAGITPPPRLGGGS